MKIAAIDFETANNQPASVCSIGVCIMEDGVIEDTFYTLIKPIESVSTFLYRNIMIHGIHPEDVENAPTFEEVYVKLRPMLEGNVVTAHNAPFDIGCLKAACYECGLKLPTFEYFDTVQLSRMVYPELPRHRLNDVCDYLQVELDHHNAMSDAAGCMMIVINAMNAFGEYDIYELLRKTHTRMKKT